MARLAFLFFAVSSGAVSTAFVTPHVKLLPKTSSQNSFVLHASRKHEESKGEAVQMQSAFSVGTFVEFAEKGRVHVGKIASSEHKTKGGARYDVVDVDGKHFKIADKAVSFAMPAPTNEPAAERLMNEFIEAQAATESDLRTKLDISPDLLEMAWEETASEEEETHELTPKSLIDLIHSHAASPIETYMAWRLLKTDMSHVFFRELKQNGRVVAFKAKARKAVDAAKNAFCSKEDNQKKYDFCFV